MLLSFLIGIFCIYFANPVPTEVTVYPTVDSSHLFQFRDKINNCFQLKQSVVKCSNDVEEIPIQL
jgi:hypothetical protein